MQRVAVINVVGLTSRLLQSGHLPRLQRWRQRGWLAPIQPAFPAVTCTAQANYLTGCLPAQHGIVGNGWYHRELAEVHFWKQSNHLVTAPKIWERLRQRHPGFTCAKLFWWFNMYSSADWSITPRPMYPADGRKIFDIYTWPFELKPDLKRELGEFPFPTFWGPAAGVASPQGPPEAASRWIAAAAQWMERKFQPHLHLIYLPHLDYNLQRHGPDAPTVPADLQRVDEITGELLDFFTGRGVAPVVLSEYGLVPVHQPVHLNRLLRQEAWLVLKEELGRELLDAGASRAFAVADHQVAHVYVKNPADLPAVRRLLEKTPGVARVLGPEEIAAAGLRHPRAGDLIAVAAPNAWFTYYYWLDDTRAPDFARTVDIHRKPGYDPVELFLDPALRFPRLKIGWRLLQKRLGFRMLMDVIPLEASLVKGSHGAPPAEAADYPVFIAPCPLPESPPQLPSTAIAAALEAVVESRMP
ncbi:alkaline phosphatase family protein [Fontisphaera persica]|uniref:alkaline phosphatase family protein n=1 Tax=Fontisphaera persica TaxID=2974023 RepID=UPI0024C0A9B5|nr:nucleotide pyrophosphatase/phosphodiesterase family protein [Fontisphaera persica]WCJ58581.1 alkaline phosphatase family protein [Fontisphaera persica]